MNELQERWSPAMGTVTTAIRGRIGIDTRSLAAFRILAGLLIIADIILRVRTFSMMYTDDGVLPVSLARSLTPEWAISVFWVSGEPAVVAGLFVLYGVVGLTLLLGYHSRLSTLLAFILVLSLDFRNPLVLSYADWLFRLLLFWAIFLPLGERWSIDAVHRDRNARASVAGLGSFMLLAQMIFMYFLNGLHKTQSETWQTGEAAILVFGLDDTTFLLGDAMRAFPSLIGLGGRLWFYLLLASPLLVLLWGRWRSALVTVFVLGHLAFAVTVRIGAFPYVAILGLLAFLQRSAWDDLDTIAHRVGLRDQYDHLANRLSTNIAEVPRFRIDDERLHTAIQRTYTITLVLVVLSFVTLAVVLVPHVGLFTDTDVDREQRFHELIDESTVGSTIHSIHESAWINQPSWNIFAPEPRAADRYYVFAAKTTGGEWIDIFNDRPVSFDRPHRELHRQHDTYRQRFFMTRIAAAGDAPIVDAYGDYLCGSWEEAQGDELVSISMFQIHEFVTIETIDAPEDREVRVSRFNDHACPGHELAPYAIDSA